MKPSWNTDIGIELTFLPKRVTKEMERNNWDERWDELTQEYRKLAVSCDMPRAEKIYQDPGCVEYPSPILQNWKTAEKWYEAATSLGRMLDLEPFQENQASGMGHIHMGIPRHLRGEIVHGIIERPYLTWAFAGPYNHDYCFTPMLHIIDALKIDRLTHHYHIDYCIQRAETRLARMFTGADESTHVSHRYMPALRVQSDNPTLEWRAFDAAADWEMQEEHIMFTQAMVIFFKNNKQSQLNMSDLFNSHMTHTNNFELCAEKFEKFITKDLKLDWGRYSWYVDRNLEPYMKDQVSEDPARLIERLYLSSPTTSSRPVDWIQYIN